MLAPAADAVGAATFSGTWASIKLVLAAPDQRSLAQGLPRTTHARLDALWAALDHDQMRGPCMAFVRRNDVLAILAASAASDTPAGVRAAVLAGLARVIPIADPPTLADPAVVRPLKHLLLALVPDASAEPPPPSDTDSLDSIFSESNLVPWVVRDDPSDAGAAVYPGSAAQGSPAPTPSGTASSPELASLVHFLAVLVRRTSDCPDLLAALSSHSGKLTRFLPYEILVPLISSPNPLGLEVRASLVACVEMAMHRAPLPLGGEPDFVLQSLALAHQVARSNIAPMLGAALGAAYGLLPRAVRLQLGKPQDAGGVPLGMRISPDVPAIEEPLPCTTEDDVAGPLADLLDLLHFVSRTLTAFLEPGDSVSPSLSTEDLHAAHTERLHLGLDCAWHITISVRTGFIDQILYPAILECSDADGSATAVFFYLTQMVEYLPNSSPLSAVLLGRLFDDGDEPDPPGASAAESKPRLRYTLKDLLLAHLRSSTFRETHIQALRLLDVLVHSHGRLVTRLLFRTTPAPQTEFPPLPPIVNSMTGSGKEPPAPPSPRKSGTERERRHSRSESKSRPAHGRRSSTLSSNPEDASASISKAQRRRTSALPLGKFSHEAQERHWLQLRIMSGMIDCLSSLSSYKLGRGLLGLTETNRVHGFSLLSAQREALALISSDSMFQWGMYTRSAEGHRLHHADKVHGLLLSSLAGWFANDPQVNLALSGVISSLVACPVRSLEGWLRFPPGVDTLPVAAKTDAPIVLVLLKGLVGQAISLRQQVGGEMDVLLGERMSGFVYMEQLLDALLEPEDVRTLGGGRPPAQVDDKTEMVANSKVRKAWDSLSLPGLGGGVSLVESTSKALNAPAFTPMPTRQRDGLARLFGGRGKDDATAHDEPEKTKPIAPGRPFADHYARTEAVQVCVRPLALPQPYRKTKVLRFALAGVGDDGAREDEDDPAPVSLSSFLDNVVLLREAVRELAALLQARAALGVDL